VERDEETKNRSRKNRDILKKPYCHPKGKVRGESGR